MIAARDVLERRLVAVLEQQSGVDMPPPWDSFRPREENLRPAAALLLRIATMKDRDAMAAELRGMAGRIRQNRKTRIAKSRTARTAKESRAFGSLSPRPWTAWVRWRRGSRASTA